MKDDQGRQHNRFDRGIWKNILEFYRIIPMDYTKTFDLPSCSAGTSIIPVSSSSPQKLPTAVSAIHRMVDRHDHDHNHDHLHRLISDV
jgi:hypothetical protein